MKTLILKSNARVRRTYDCSAKDQGSGRGQSLLFYLYVRANASCERITTSAEYSDITLVCASLMKYRHTKLKQ